MDTMVNRQIFIFIINRYFFSINSSKNYELLTLCAMCHQRCLKFLQHDSYLQRDPKRSSDLHNYKESPNCLKKKKTTQPLVFYIFQNFLKLCVCVCVGCVYLVPTKARIEHQILCSWSFKRLRSERGPFLQACLYIIDLFLIPHRAIIYFLLQWFG